MKKNLKESVKAGRYGVQFSYVFDCIKNSSLATDEGMKFATDFDCISFFFDCFEEEFNHDYNRRLFPNLVDRISNYLQGFPSCCSVAFYYYDIEEIGKSWGYCNNPRQCENFKNNWFNRIAFRLVQIAQKTGRQLPR